MEKNEMTVDERLYLEAKRYCRSLKPEKRGDFYYVLLDWCDRHQEITDALAKRHTVYEIAYIDSSGNSHNETFTPVNGENPYPYARKRYGELLGESVLVAELRRLPNPYLSGPDRMGAVIMSYEQKE